MVDDEYELLPHKLLADLKYDVEALKQKLTEPDTKTNELILEIESLKDSIHELNVVFQKALEHTQEEGNLDKVVSTLKEKVDTVVSQNETIAKGMIAISDKLEDFMSTGHQINRAPMQHAPIQHTMGAPAISGRVAPPIPPNSGGMDLPPPPPGEKRKGLFK